MTTSLPPHTINANDPTWATREDLEAALEAAWAGSVAGDGPALVVPTAGSTGEPKLVSLSAQAMSASAQLTGQVLGEGAWLLSLPLSHIAGWMVAIRSWLTGHPIYRQSPGSFHGEGWLAATNELPSHTPLFTSLVPTQLQRLLQSPDPAIRLALQRFEAILVGGAQCPDNVLEQCRASQIRVVRTYGMSETSGGCVYDGLPLPGVHLDLTSDGRLIITSPTLADGYWSDPERSAGNFITDGAGRRSFVSSDLGRLSTSPVGVTTVQVLGRADDVILSGGENIHPVPIEAALRDLPGVLEVVVVGVPDADWGQAVTAVVLPNGDQPPPSLAEVRTWVNTHLSPTHAPRHLLITHDIPQVGLGKPDRPRVSAWAAAQTTPSAPQ